MHADVPLKAASLSHVKIFNFTSQLICHSLWQYFMISKNIQPPALDGYYYWVAALFFVFQIYSTFLNNNKTHPDSQYFHPNLQFLTF